MNSLSEKIDTTETTCKGTVGMKPIKSWRRQTESVNDLGYFFVHCTMEQFTGIMLDPLCYIFKLNTTLKFPFFLDGKWKEDTQVEFPT